MRSQRTEKPTKQSDLERLYMPDFSGPIQPAPTGCRNTKPEDVKRVIAEILRERTVVAQS